MPYYSLPGLVHTMSTAFISAATITGPTASSRRIKIYELVLGATANPAATDTAIEVDLSRVTATGTGTATLYTPVASDVGDGAATGTGNITYTTEPQTITASSTLYKIGMNQRATVRWIAAQESQYITTPNASGSGFVLRALSANYASSFGGQISFME